MQKRASARSVLNEQMSVRLETLKRLLAEDSFKIFTPRKRLVLTGKDFIAARNKSPTMCILVRPRRDNKVELRVFEFNSISQERLANQIKSNLKSSDLIGSFVFGKKLPKSYTRHPWRYFIDPCHKDELQEIFRYDFKPQR